MAVLLVVEERKLRALLDGAEALEQTGLEMGQAMVVFLSMVEVAEEMGVGIETLLQHYTPQEQVAETVYQTLITAVAELLALALAMEVTETGLKVAAVAALIHLALLVTEETAE
jgi:hypothetical protein